MESEKVLDGLLNLPVPTWSMALGMGAVDPKAGHRYLLPLLYMLKQPANVHIVGSRCHFHLGVWCRLAHCLDQLATLSTADHELILRQSAHASDGNKLVSEVKFPEILRNLRDHFTTSRGVAAAEDARGGAHLIYSLWTLDLPGLQRVKGAELFGVEVQADSVLSCPGAELPELFSSQSEGRKTIHLRGCGHIGKALSEQILVLVRMIDVLGDLGMPGDLQNLAHLCQRSV
mmetsp:Transcript_44068/g.95951  ORF Transcript_44068/g.95951 Transcript_44068/m.95951 type:complete len:231 (+) Transcript_44068:907-1599(+)